MNLTINDLKKCFYEASTKDAKYVGVLIEMEGFPKPEAIINQNDNFDSKFDYYNNTYDENLNHKYANGIKIISFAYGNSFAEIEGKLLNRHIREVYVYGISTEEQLKAVKDIVAQDIASKDEWNSKPDQELHNKITNKLNIDDKAKVNWPGVVGDGEIGYCTTIMKMNGEIYYTLELEKSFEKGGCLPVNSIQVKDGHFIKL